MPKATPTHRPHPPTPLPTRPPPTHPLAPNSCPRRYRSDQRWPCATPTISPSPFPFPPTPRFLPFTPPSSPSPARITDLSQRPLVAGLGPTPPFFGNNRGCMPPLKPNPRGGYGERLHDDPRWERLHRMHLAEDLPLALLLWAAHTPPPAAPPSPHTLTP